MSYQIRSVTFQDFAPDVGTIAQFIEDKSSHKVVIAKREFQGQFEIFMEKYPEDILGFEIRNKDIVISGYAEAAPALCDIFYSCLIMLGGKTSYQVDVIDFPITDDEIESLNRKVRGEIRKHGMAIWAYILLMLTLFCGLIYTILFWVF